jgi:hypothetical protein
MDMVGHQHDGMYGDAELRDGLPEAELKVKEVLIAREDWRSVVPALDDMMWLTLDEESRRPSHDAPPRPADVAVLAAGLSC